MINRWKIEYEEYDSKCKRIWEEKYEKLKFIIFNKKI